MASHVLLHCSQYQALRKQCLKDIVGKVSCLPSTRIAPALLYWLKGLSCSSQEGRCFARPHSAKAGTARMAFFLGGPPPDSPQAALDMGERALLLPLIDKSVRLFLHKVQVKREACIRALAAPSPSCP